MNEPIGFRGNMVKKISVEALIWLALSILLGIKSVQLELGTFSTPGPGFMPFGVALLVFILSLVLFIQPYFLRIEKVRQSLNFRMNSIFIILCMIVYVFFFKEMGYIVSSLLLWTVIFKLVGTKRWRWALIEGILVTFSSYLIFGVALKLNLPVGLFFF